MADVSIYWNFGRTVAFCVVNLYHCRFAMSWEHTRKVRLGLGVSSPPLLSGWTTDWLGITDKAQRLSHMATRLYLTEP